MAFTTIFDEIVFIEGNFPGATRGEAIKADFTRGIGGQLKSLNDIKRNLAKKAKNSGFNAIIDFKYGQKSRFFSFDNVGFWGEGTLANIPQSEYDRASSAS